jgi:hypothetical protein
MRPGWPDWAIFHQLGYMLLAHLRNSPKMAIPWATNLLHFHLNKPFKKWFLIWHYFVWLLFNQLGNFFSKSFGHTEWDPASFPSWWFFRGQGNQASSFAPTVIDKEENVLYL